LVLDVLAMAFKVVWKRDATTSRIISFFIYLFYWLTNSKVHCFILNNVDKLIF